jgi:hypothetical protein
MDPAVLAACTCLDYPRPMTAVKLSTRCPGLKMSNNNKIRFLQHNNEELAVRVFTRDARFAHLTVRAKQSLLLY